MDDKWMTIKEWENILLIYFMIYTPKNIFYLCEILSKPS